MLFLAGVEDSNAKRERFDFWNNVYGFDSKSPVKDIAITELVVDLRDDSTYVFTYYLLNVASQDSIATEQLARELTLNGEGGNDFFKIPRNTFSATEPMQMMILSRSYHTLNRVEPLT